MADRAEKKKRVSDRQYVLLRVEPRTPEAPCAQTYELVIDALPDRGACDKLIGNSGADGNTYQVATFVGGPVTVKVEHVAKRTLRPAAEGVEPDEGGQ